VIKISLYYFTKESIADDEFIERKCSLMMYYGGRFGARPGIIRKYACSKFETFRQWKKQKFSTKV
jgi:hypothetical protein